MLDFDGIGNALALDLVEYLPDLSSYDAIISAHPWSTVIVAACLLQRHTNDPMLVDCHGEFAPFPVSVHPRVDLYVGGRIQRSLPWKIRARCVPTGIPVRRQFDARGVPKQNKLVVMLGADGRSDAGVAECLPAIIRAVKPDTIVVLSGYQFRQEIWQEAGPELDRTISFVSDRDDVSDILADTKWLLTKASGSPVAEGFVSGCHVLCFASGVFWEDEARAYLSAERVVFPVGPADCLGDVVVDDIALNAIADQCSSANENIWSTIEGGREPPRSDLEAKAVALLRSNVELDDPIVRRLERTSEVFRELCSVWDAGIVD